MEHLVIRAATLPSDLPQIYEIRYRVFQQEQGVDSKLEFDGFDDQCDHVLAYLNHQAVGTARIRYLNARVAKVERVAVLAHLRGRGIGKQLMETVLALLTDKGVSTAQIHAQVGVRSFYHQLGFVAEGETFEEAGIPHIKMSKQLG